MRKIKLKRKHREIIFGYLFISVWIIGFLIFTLLPICRSLYYSFHQVQISTDGIKVLQFINNFKEAIVNNISFMESLFSYIKDTVLMVPSVIVFAVAIAILLNKKMRCIGIFRVIYFLPVVIASSSVLFNLQEQGAMVIPSISDNNFIELIVSTLPGFFGEFIGTIFDKIVIIMWFTGVPIILILSGLQKIDASIYEAAKVDGASGWESFWKITLPALRSVINIAIVYTVISISMFSSRALQSIIDSRKTTNYGLANAFSWIYFMATVLVLLLFLAIVNFRPSSIFYKKNRRRMYHEKNRSASR